MSDFSTPTWRPHPRITNYVFDVLADDADFASDCAIGWVEDFGYACYPTALNAKTGNRERGGPHKDRVAARLWVERVAGLHPAKPSDARPAYYHREAP